MFEEGMDSITFLIYLLSRCFLPGVAELGVYEIVIEADIYTPGIKGLPAKYFFVGFG
jgi:hypothetical protein